MSLQLADLLPGQPDAKRALTGAAGLLAAVSDAGVRSAVAETVTVTTTTQYGPTPLSYDVLFTPIADATDLVSISAGSVYTGEGPSFTIQAIGSDDTTVDLFFDPFNGAIDSTVKLSNLFSSAIGKVLVTTTSETLDFFNRSIAGPESTAWVAAIITSLAPASINASTAFVTVPAVSIMSSITTQVMPLTSPTTFPTVASLGILGSRVL